MCRPCPATTARSWVISNRPMPSSSTSPLQQVEDLRLGGHVERGGRLVGDQQLRAQRDGHGDARPAGAGRRTARAGSASAESRSAGRPTRVEPRPGDVRASRREARPCTHQGFRHLVADGLDRVERRHRFLEDHADVGCRACCTSRARFSPARRLSSSQAWPDTVLRAVGSRPIIASAVIDLPEPLSPDQPGDLAGRDIEGDVAQDRRRRECRATGPDREQDHAPRPPQPRVEHIAQPVAHQVQPQHRE